MGIDSDSDKAASLVIGPTSLGMVRIYIETDGIELPMDFEPDEALEIAGELRSAAERAAAMKPEKGDGNGRDGKPGPEHNPKLNPKHGGGGGRRG